MTDAEKLEMRRQVAINVFKGITVQLEAVSERLMSLSIDTKNPEFERSAEWCMDRKAEVLIEIQRISSQPLTNSRD